MSNNDGPSLLEGLQMGSIVFGETGRIGATILQPGITAVDPKIQKIKDWMSSNSHYMHNANSNAGSLSVSGSYGVSGLSQVQAGLAVAVSRDKSDLSNSLSIEMQRIMVAGTEYIDFDSLKPEQFIASLKGAPVSVDDDDPGTGVYFLMVRVLSAYQSLIEIGNPNDTTDFDTKLQEWLKAKESFFSDAGNLLVVGIVWGGWGGVRLSFEAVNDETLWKAGAKAKFSYAGVGASIGVGASFGHTEITEDQKKSGSVHRISHGKCVEGLVDKWETTLNDILSNKVDKIDKTKVGDLGDAPIPDLPDAPGRVTPKSPKGMADKIKSVRDMKGLEALAKAAAYDSYVKASEKKGEEPKSLDEFLKNAAKPNDVSGLTDSVDAAGYEGDDDSGDDIVPNDLLQQAKADAKLPEVAKPTSAFDDYIAVGAWLVPWAQIFPWLAEPQSNMVQEGALNSSLLRLRLLESDAQTLATTYRHLELMKVNIPSLDLDPGPIAVAFKSMHAKAHELLREHMSVLGGKYSSDQLDLKIKDTILRNLGQKYRKIYTTWSNNSQLRKCELGSGVVVGSADVVESDPNLTFTGLKYEKVKNGQYKDCDTWVIVTEICDFDKDVQNYEAFATAIKVAPVILPNGGITAFISWEDDNLDIVGGILCANKYHPSGCCVSRSFANGINPTTIPTLFEPVIFRQSSVGLRAYLTTAIRREGKVSYMNSFLEMNPIPYKAAEGIDWIGGASSVGISDITAKLDELRGQLSKLTQWSLGSEYWSDRDSDSPILALQQLHPFYIGLIDEPALFNKSS